MLRARRRVWTGCGLNADARECGEWWWWWAGPGSGMPSLPAPAGAPVGAPVGGCRDRAAAAAGEDAPATESRSIPSPAICTRRDIGVMQSSPEQSSPVQSRGAQCRVRMILRCNCSTPSAAPLAPRLPGRMTARFPNLEHRRDSTTKSSRARADDSEPSPPNPLTRSMQRGVAYRGAACPAPTFM